MSTTLSVGTVFQTAAYFMFVIPRLRPGLLSLRSVLSSRQTLTGQKKISMLMMLFSGFVVLLFSDFVECINNAINKTTRQQNNQTTKQLYNKTIFRTVW